MLHQSLQGELQNSEAKGVGLERQVSQLSARINSGRSWGGESEAVCGGGRGSGGGKSSEVIEAGMASLRRQLNSANEVGTALEHADLFMNRRYNRVSPAREKHRHMLQALRFIISF